MTVTKRSRATNSFRLCKSSTQKCHQVLDGSNRTQNQTAHAGLCQLVLQLGKQIQSTYTCSARIFHIILQVSIPSNQPTWLERCNSYPILPYPIMFYPILSRCGWPQPLFQWAPARNVLSVRKKSFLTCSETGPITM
jgi:hypothetical protein